MGVDDVVRETKRAIHVLNAIQANIEKIERQLQSLRSVLEAIQKDLESSAQVSYEDIAKKLVEERLKGRWENLSSGQKKMYTEAVREVIEAYTQGKKLSPEAVKVLGKLYAGRTRKKATVFNTLLINLTVKEIVDEERLKVLNKFRNLWKEGKLQVLNSSSATLRSASISSRSFDKLFTDKRIADVRKFLLTILGPYLRTQKDLFHL